MRYTPFETMDRMFEQMRRDMAEWRENAWDASPFEGTATDLTEHDDEFVLTLDLPGFEKDEIDLRFDDGTLYVSAEHGEGDESSSRRRSIAERMTFPKEVDEEGISASYHNGVLEVHLPIAADAVDRGHRIDVE